MWTIFYFLLCFWILHSTHAKKSPWDNCNSACGFKWLPRQTSRALGWPVTNIQFPWVAFVKLYAENCITEDDSEATYSCTGTIIDHSWLTIAQHCFHIPPKCTYGNTGVTQRIHKVLVYPNIHNKNEATADNQYEVDMDRIEHVYNLDLAVLHLKTPIPEHVARPACLMSIVDLKENQEMVAQGYGLYVTRNDKGQQQWSESQVLRESKVMYTNNCPRTFYSKKRPSFFLCGKGTLKGIGMGDSGGPLNLDYAPNWAHVVGTSSASTVSAHPPGNVFHGDYTRMTRLCEIISAITSNEVNCITKVPTPAERKKCKEPVPPNPAVPQNAAFQLADNEYFDNEFNDDEEDERTLACKRNPYRWDCPQFKKNVIPGGTF